jgi:hypothetical protein
MSTNLSLGTYVSDGVRTGPDFNNSKFANNGKGVLLSSQTSYNIYCSAPNPTGGRNTTNNVVDTTTIAAAGYLTLFADNYVTFLTRGPDGFPILQLDQPRVITVTTAVANPTPGTRVTIMGNDKLGSPMQHTYILTATQGIYPTFNFPGGADIPTMTFPGNGVGNIINTATKAFYQITKVYISAGIGGGGTISLGAADAFGLPYVIKGNNNIINTGEVVNASCGVVSSIQWGRQTGNNAQPIIIDSNMTTRAFGEQLDTKGFLFTADKRTATATTGDVRGFYAPDTAAATQFTAVNTKPILDATNLVFTYFVAGADASINQQANDQQNYMQSNHVNSPQGIPVKPTRPENLVGVPEFYTGLPS